MYYLAEILPFLKKIKRLPLTRDQLFLLIAAINELFMGLDTYLAHTLNGTIRWNEWIPIIFGTIAGVFLLFAGLIAYKNRRIATFIAVVIFALSIIVGFLGSYFHISRSAVLPGGSTLQQFHISFLIWAPPAMAPLAFVLVGILGLSAAAIEDPIDSGRLKLSENKYLQMPYSKTRAYFFMVTFGILITVVSSTLDHARTGFENPWLWLPLLSPIFAGIVAFMMGIKDKISYSDLLTYFIAMVILGVVGVIGFVLHIQTDLTAGGQIVIERFLRGAPFLAPLLYANMAAMGILVLLDPKESTDK